ncbi:MAG TPA: uroporphyrinogen-III synthase [Candidatus Limnocylindria bacterium]|nr:uroporphyrinogen-III synthase [Candidatus Limnocylindria bacterium]
MLLTRAPGDNDSLAARLRSLGLAPCAAPCMRIEALADPAPLRNAIRSLSRGDTLVLTSRSGATAVADALGGAACRARIAVVGLSTAEACRDRGLAVAFAPSEPTGAALAEQLPLPLGIVLLARADRAAHETAEILRRRGAKVREIAAYRTVPAFAGVAGELPRADAVVFASPSAVDGFAAALSLGDAAVIAIGPTTAARVRVALAVEPTVAARPDDDAVAAAIITALEARDAIVRR